jgi:hypothetical protein
MPIETQLPGAFVRERLDGARSIDCVPRRISVLVPCRQEKSTWLFRQVPVFPTESGRRDWTRTNDPHHVKVVL